MAGGKGYLRSSLYERGYKVVTTWDKRHHLARGRPGTRWGHFHWDEAPPEFDVVVGMHPDGATDHIVRYAGKHRVPFIVCPCCIIPSAAVYWGQHHIGAWVEHLVQLAGSEGLGVEQIVLPMAGRNVVLIGHPRS